MSGQKQTQIKINFGNEDWTLDYRRILLNRKRQLLICSDLHLGYYASLRSNGSYLPTYDKQELNILLESLIKDFSDYSWIINGDVKHSHMRTNKLSLDEKMEIVNGLRKISSCVNLEIVLGNHDEGIIELIEEQQLPIACLEYKEIDDFFIIHDFGNNKNLRNKFTISGHIHPTFKLNNLIIPIFAIGRKNIILPSINYVAGGFDITKVNLEDWHCYGLFSDNIKYFGTVNMWNKKK